MTTKRVIVYEDLNCPFCYALSDLTRREGLLSKIEWRGVQHAEFASVPWKAPSPALKDMIRQEVASARARCPELECRAPYGQPNTSSATLWVAAAMRHDEEGGHRLKDELKRALFVDGRDISDDAVLEEVRKSLPLPVVEIDDALTDQVGVWQSAWQAMSPRMIPTMIAPAGTIRRGLGEPEEALEFIRQHA